MQLEPQQCVAFEDSENGVKSAYDAGIRSILVTTNAYTEGHDFKGASLVVDKFGEQGEPFHAISGPTGGKSLVDMQLIESLHGGE